MDKLELFESIGWDGMMLVTYTDGEMEVCQAGSCYFVKEIFSKTPLDKWYWRASLIDWGFWNEDEHSIKENISDEDKEEFILQSFENELNLVEEDQ